MKLSPESIAEEVAFVLKHKIVRAIVRRLDAGMIIRPYANELAVSAALNEYMNNPTDDLADQIARLSTNFPDNNKPRGKQKVKTHEHKPVKRKQVPEEG